MKNVLKKSNILSFIIGGFIFGIIGIVSATILYQANEIGYTPNDESEINNVQDALDDLYNKQTNTITSLNNQITELQNRSFELGTPSHNIFKGTANASNKVTSNLTDGKYLVVVSMSYAYGDNSTRNSTSTSSATLTCNNNCNIEKITYYGTQYSCTNKWNNIYNTSMLKSGLYVVESIGSNTLTLKGFGIDDTAAPEVVDLQIIPIN